MSIVQIGLEKSDIGSTWNCLPKASVGERELKMFSQIPGEFVKTLHFYWSLVAAICTAILEL